MANSDHYESEEEWPAPDIVLTTASITAVKTVKTTATDEFLISPITGEKIPASKVQEHMRIGLLDPRWVEQRDKHIQDKLNQETVYAPGSAIEASLKQLAERRTDIFGVGDEETAIGKKIGEEDKKEDKNEPKRCHCTEQRVLHNTCRHSQWICSTTSETKRIGMWWSGVVKGRFL
ncbi:splicing factor 3a, subunit 1 [Homalodisca vitripennis]|nr:splicing factor 3a, subunit 1 [Homalodisca vitripennis]